eukprot:276631_1
MNSLNTIYGYIYSSTIYNFDVAFLLCGLFSSLIICFEIILNLKYLMQQFVTDLELMHVDYSVVSWINDNFTILALLTIMTNSCDSSILLFNSNLFGIDKFSMMLSDLQIKQFQGINNNKILLLSMIKTCIHCFAFGYILHCKYEENSTIKIFAIISVIFGLVNIASTVTTQCRNRNTFTVKKIKFIIECNEEDDIKQIKQFKCLTKEILQKVSECIEVKLKQLEILSIENCENGIMLIFMYNNIVNRSNDIEKNPLLEKMLTCDPNIQSIYMTLNDLNYNHAFKQQIKQIYHLENVPSNVSCKIIQDNTTYNGDTTELQRVFESNLSSFSISKIIEP